GSADLRRRGRGRARRGARRQLPSGTASRPGGSRPGARGGVAARGAPRDGRAACGKGGTELAPHPKRRRATGPARGAGRPGAPRRGASPLVRVLHSVLRVRRPGSASRLARTHDRGGGMADVKRVAINGLGRIGRATLKVIHESHPDLEVAAVNDIAAADDLAYLLHYDSVYGRFGGDVRA